MALAGNTPCCPKPRGGVHRLLLVAAHDVASVDSDPADGSFSLLRLKAGASPVGFFPCEDGAWLEETATVHDGVVSVRHTLEVAFDAGPGSQAVLDSLARIAPRGVVALVQNPEGGTLLVGYSHKFANARPLKASRWERTGGSKPTDKPLCKITLVSDDTLASRPYTGPLPD